MDLLVTIIICIVGATINLCLPPDLKYMWGFIVASLLRLIAALERINENKNQ